MHRPAPRTMVALACALLAASIPGLSSPRAVDAATSPAFGMAAHLMWFDRTSDALQDLDRMQAAGMTYVRFDVSWRNMEPVRGSYRYLGKLDTIVAGIRARGMRLTMTVLETPGWANGGRSMFYPPANVGDYARFVGMLARRYAANPGMVWEVWNEPNLVQFWSSGPNATRYTALLKAAYRSIKASDPDATVLVGGIAFNDVRFMNAIYAAGGGSSFNGIAIHPYTGRRAPSDTTNAWFSFRGSVPQFTRLMASHGQSKPIWITEFGYSTADVSDATRASYLRAAVTIARRWTNVRGVATYTMHESQFFQFGLIGLDGTPTRSWTAYSAIVRTS